MSRTLVLGIVAFGAIGLTAGCISANDQAQHMTKDQIEAQLKRDLPLGTPRESVVAYLDKRTIDNSARSSAVPANRIVAMFRNIGGGTLLVKKSLQVTFQFKDEKLASYSFEEKLTGP